MSEKKEYNERTPYQLAFPKDAQNEIVIPNAIPEDDRLWVPQAENVWLRPLCLNRSQGYWTNLLKVTKAGVLSRHRHPQPVHGWVLKGRWHYLEHDWMAEEGSYVYEPPGETHTLVVPEGVDGRVEYKGNVSKIIYQLKGGLRSSMGYVGAKKLKNIKTNAKFIKITKAGFYESMVHSVEMIESTLNYKL